MGLPTTKVGVEGNVVDSRTLSSNNHRHHNNDLTTLSTKVSKCPPLRPYREEYLKRRAVTPFGSNIVDIVSDTPEEVVLCSPVINDSKQKDIRNK